MSRVKHLENKKDEEKIMKKIIAVVLLLVIAVTCAACSQNNATTNNTATNTAKEPETKVYTYTIINETGKEVNSLYLADDNSANKAEATFEGNGMEIGGKVEISVSAVPDKDGNPSLTASYKIGDTEYMTKVTVAEAEIKLTAEGADSGAFEINAPQK